jgi:replicative DNA helicase
MESSDYTRLDYKTINEFFPKGQLSILAAGPGVGKTVFATQIANQFCRHGENTLYFCLEYDSRVIINHLDPVGNGNVRCCITDIPRISLEDILLAIKKRYFNVIIIDYVELMDSTKTLDGINRAEELRAIWMSLDKMAKENDIRIIGVSQLIRIRIDGSEKALPDDCLSYLDREFLTKRIKVLHRESYYSNDSNSEDLEPVSIIEYVFDSSYITILRYI